MIIRTIKYNVSASVPTWTFFNLCLPFLGQSSQKTTAPPVRVQEGTVTLADLSVPFFTYSCAQNAKYIRTLPLPHLRQHPSEYTETFCIGCAIHHLFTIDSSSLESGSYSITLSRWDAVPHLNRVRWRLLRPNRPLTNRLQLR